ncbi:TRAP transporter small permease [Deltaproteobacteria bacterium]|nr:TRAP transporter small permease [Deltaproteobacteria bacterium]
MVKLLDRLCAALAVAAGSLFIFVTFSICYSVFTRAIHAPSPVWIIQFNEYSMLWITFLGTAWLLPREKHISIKIVMFRLTEKARRRLRICHDILGVILCLAFCYYCTNSTWEHYVRKIIDVQAIDVPKAFILVVIPVGFFLLSLQFIRRLVEDISINKSNPPEVRPVPDDAE